MARADLARARRLLETIDDESSPGQPSNPSLVPFGLGTIAGELAVKNPAQARELLDEAFARLRRLAVDAPLWQGQTSVANWMANLLPIVEQLEPERLAERVWLTAASRPPSALEPTSPILEGTFTLAMLVARYDRAIADVIVAADLERLPDLLLLGPNWPYNYAIPTIARSLTTYDPRLIAPLLKALPESARKPPPNRDASSSRQHRSPASTGRRRDPRRAQRGQAEGGQWIGVLHSPRSRMSHLERVIKARTPLDFLEVAEPDARLFPDGLHTREAA